MTRNERWILSEFQVARDRCFRRGNERLILHRERTPFAEIDLLTRSPSGELTLIEVKTCSGGWGPEMMPQKQIRRLMRARQYLEDERGAPVGLLLAAVFPVSPRPREARLDSEVRYFDLSSRLY